MTKRKDARQALRCQVEKAASARGAVHLLDVGRLDEGQRGKDLARLLDVRGRLLDLGADPSPMPVAQFKTWSQGEVSKWTRLVKEAGIQPE